MRRVTCHKCLSRLKDRHRSFCRKPQRARAESKGCVDLGRITHAYSYRSRAQIHAWKPCATTSRKRKCSFDDQGSVLSPILFLLVMDPILLELKNRSCGPSVCGLYLGAFSHADDIRTLSTNISDCKLQINLVSEFATSQGLTLNVDKCEASISPSIPAIALLLSVLSHPVPIFSLLIPTST